MANTFSTAWMDSILARMLVHARPNVVLPQLVNTDWAPEVAAKGDTINIKVPAELATYDITPGPTRSAGADFAPVTRPLILNQHKGSGFRLTSKEAGEVRTRDILPMEIQEAVNAVVEGMNQAVANEYKAIYGYQGDAAQALFQKVAAPAASYEDTHILSDCFKELSRQAAPVANRHFVMGIDEHGSALRLESFKDASKAGGTDARNRADLGMVAGLETHWQFFLPTHTAGTQTGDPDTTGASALGAKAIGLTCDVDDTVGYVLGDIITFAADSQTYVVTDVAGVTIGNSAAGTVNIEPGLKVAQSGSDAVTLKAAHRVNLAFHPMCFGLALRGAQNMRVDGGQVGNGKFRTLADEVTGLVLTLGVFPEYHQDWIEVSALYGTACTVPHLGVRAAAAVI